MSIARNIKSLTTSLKFGSDSDGTSKALNIASSFKSMPSILSKDFELEGNISGTGVLEIEGRVRGTIKGNSVVIREEGVVEGKIDVDTINIRGKFSGDMKARSISIFKKAKIVGNIEYCFLSVEDGASIEGQFKQVTDKKIKKVIESQ